MKHYLIGLSAGLLLAAPALAQETRYTLEKTEDGFVRMETETGQISVCTMTSDQLVCRMATDDRDAYNADIEALEERVAALEARLGAGRSGDALPSDEEFEKTLGYMERFMRSFMGIVEDFAEDSDSNNEPMPDRT
jgi:Mg2+ and Co2+ transporter CorA